MDRHDLTPTLGMQKEARRYLRWKNAGHRGGTGVATRRAHQILAAKPLPPATVQTMAAWFARHAVDFEAVGFRPEEDEYPSPGRVAWAAWGGDPGERWSRRMTDRLRKEGIIGSHDWSEFEGLAFLANSRSTPAHPTLPLSAKEMATVRKVARHLFSHHRKHAARALLIETGVSLGSAPPASKT